MDPLGDSRIETQRIGASKIVRTMKRIKYMNSYRISIVFDDLPPSTAIGSMTQQM